MSTSVTDTRPSTGLTKELEEQRGVLQVRLDDYSESIIDAVDTCCDELVLSIHNAGVLRSAAERVATTSTGHKRAKNEFEAVRNDGQAQLGELTALAGEMLGLCLQAGMLVRRLALIPDDMLCATANPLGELIKRMKFTAAALYDTGFVAYAGTRLLRDLLDFEALLVVKIIDENITVLEETLLDSKIKEYGLDNLLRNVLKEISGPSTRFSALLRDGKSECVSATAVFKTLTKQRTRACANLSRSDSPNEEDRLRSKIRVAANSIRLVSIYALTTFVSDPANGEGMVTAAKMSRVISTRGKSFDL